MTRHRWTDAVIFSLLSDDDLRLAAFQAVADHFDSGVAFEARCRSSSTFAQTVERARFLRAFSPSELRRLARGDVAGKVKR